MTIIWAIVILGALGIIFGLILAVAAKVFEVEVDPRLPEIQACLAGANCGGCGYPGCGGCAEAILAGKAPVTACAPAGPENAAKIAAIMGMEAPSGDKMVAHVLCNGGCNAKDNFEYRGVHDCLAATKVCGGDAKACRYGCFGFGSCAEACKFDAIHVVDGVVVVDKEKCTNCGACRAACPHKLIVEVPYKQKVIVNCSNKDKGPTVTKVCANSCIACGMCERTCKFDAIHVVNNVAVIDYSKCKNCTMCAKACRPPRRRRSSRPRRRLPPRRRPLPPRLRLRRLLPRKPSKKLKKDPMPYRAWDPFLTQRGFAALRALSSRWLACDTSLRAKWFLRRTRRRKKRMGAFSRPPSRELCETFNSTGAGATPRLLYYFDLLSFCT